MGTENVSAKDYYGPYPKHTPVPFLSISNERQKGGTPSENDIPTTAVDERMDRPIDYRDKGTPDEWIAREGRMVRLTGRHPFNSEPPLSLLAHYNFLTPTSLHVVRNHGLVPNLTWEDHTLFVGGPCVPHPRSFHMDELVDMRSIEFPVTISCCGNRRKEINMIRQSVGFHWGAGGVGTNVYKGVLLRNLLLSVGVDEDNIEGKHVEFIGTEDLPNKVGPGPFKEEPWPNLVKYGTSIPLTRALNPAYDVLIAYEANGEKLMPDHGFPVRLVIPGYIGGRMVKWLQRINVIDHETYNHYHYHDNKYMPPQVTEDEALQGGWWYKQEYIINELSLNSVIVSPAHDDRVEIGSNIACKMQIGGYAHTGGGRKVTRVEVSFDEGVHWNLCVIERKERPSRYGMYWCWVWWAFEIPLADLIGCQEIWCRAWDTANNPQPNEPTWSLMGQNANHVFRVKVQSDEGSLRFEHPTQPGQQPGGWATRPADKYKSAGFGFLLNEQQDKNIKN